MKRSETRRRKKSPYRFLLAVPIQLAVNIALYPIGIELDLMLFERARQQQIAEQGYAVGHGFPLLTILLPFAGLVVTAAVILVSVIVTVILVCRERRNREAAEAEREKER